MVSKTIVKSISAQAKVKSPHSDAYTYLPTVLTLSGQSCFLTFFNFQNLKKLGHPDFLDFQPVK